MAGIYVHIPFCTAKCAYCDFYSVPRLDTVEQVISAIGNEWQMRSAELNAKPRTLYIGGGTPSLLSARQFARLAELLPTDNLDEFTIEVNPDDVNAEKLSAWVTAGVNRVSMGVQSLNDRELLEVGRRHNAAQAIEAYSALRNAGIDNISLDLIYGLPGQSLQSWKYSVDKMIELRPNHISAYLLSVEPGTRLYARSLVGKFVEADEALVAQMYQYLCLATRQAGYEHYEISNFALPSYRAVHNSSYWAFEPYVGLGPAAHSFGADGVRRINPSNISKYLADIEGRGVAYVVEEESDIDRINDQIMVALRTSEGLNLDDLDAATAETVIKSVRHVPATHIKRVGSRLRIPEEYFLVSDAIIRELLV